MPDDGSLRGLLSHGAERLRRAKISQPRREAREIWADLTGMNPAQVLLDQDGAIGPDQREAFLLRVGRRAGGEPLAYVSGLAGFRRLLIRSDPRALIPRPETEGLVDLVLSRAPRGVAVDVGTGSGCIALALRDEGGYDSVIGIDRSALALGLAAENRGRTGLEVVLVQGDILAPLAPGSADLVVSNPPYLTEAEVVALDPSVRAWEPVEALVSGADGLGATRQVVSQGRTVLRSGGWLALEVDSSRSEVVAALCRADGWDACTVHSDLFGRARYVLARRSESA